MLAIFKLIRRDAAKLGRSLMGVPPTASALSNAACTDEPARNGSMGKIELGDDFQAAFRFGGEKKARKMRIRHAVQLRGVGTVAQESMVGSASDVRVRKSEFRELSQGEGQAGIVNMKQYVLF